MQNRQESAALRQTAHSPRGTARVAAGLTVLVMLLFPGSAQESKPSAPLAVPDPLVAAVAPLLSATSAELRGEAALALAALEGGERYQGAILDLTADRDPAARHRAILAWGFLSREGADARLARILEDAPRESLDRNLAALALGLLPDEPRSAAVDEFFRRSGGASRKRIQQELSCLLFGLRQSPHPSRRAVLRRFLEDDTYRDRTVLALVIDALAQCDDASLQQDLMAQLGSQEPAILAAVCTALALRRFELGTTERARVLRLTRHDQATGVRTAALRLLTRLRDPRALTVAAKALDSRHAELAAEAVRTIDQLGGSPIRDRLEDRILACTDSAVQAAMLAAKPGPYSDRFVRECLILAADATRLPAIRTQAARVAAEAGWKQVTPTLQGLFRSLQDDALLAVVAGALAELKIDATELVPMKTVKDVARFGSRLHALLAAGHETGLQLLCRVLTGAEFGDALRAEALRAFRVAALPTGGDASLLPKDVAELLRGSASRKPNR